MSEEGKVAKSGDRVRVHYVAKLEDGREFDTTSGKEPFELTLGANLAIPGFERMVEGMREGESREAVLEPEEAFGPYQEALVADIPKDSIPGHIEPEMGMVLELRGADEATGTVVITDVSDESITVDGNHPCAGQKVLFEVDLVEVL